MNVKTFIPILFVITLSFVLAFVLIKDKQLVVQDDVLTTVNSDQTGGVINSPNPLSIESLKKTETPGSDFVVEQVLDSDINFDRFIVSYKSEGLKIFGLLTVPKGEKPASGWPAIVFNHGYIAPSEYRTTERYIAYQNGFANNGYITFKSDYRGHGNSEGAVAGAYGSNSYTIDVLNAFASVKKHKDVDENRIGFWGHSMGGYITLRSMVSNRNIKAGVIWAGVVASYDDLLNNWRRRNPNVTPPSSASSSGWRQTLVEQYGAPSSNPTFWNSISANSHLSEVSGPIQLHHGTADLSVPVLFSEKLDKQLKAAKKTSEFYSYPGDDHNLTNNFDTAMQRSIEFFDKYVKNVKS